MSVVAVGSRRVLRYEGSGGVALEAELTGDEVGLPVVLLHGGGQTRHAWDEAATRIAALGFYVVVPDLRGHGRSGWSDGGDYAVERFAEDLRALAALLAQPPVLVGASLGGLTSLIAAGEAPQLAVSLVVLVDVAHRAQPEGVSRILEFMQARPDGFANVDEAAAAVAAYLPHRVPPPDASGLQHNLRRRSDGRYVWHWDPALLDGIAMLSSERLLAAARAVSAPLLLVRGGISDVVDGAIADELVARVPGADLVHVEGAGHMVAGDRNDRFVGAILPALRRAADSSSSSNAIAK